MKIKISGIEIETNENKIVSSVTLNINYENEKENITSEITYTEKKDEFRDEPITAGNLFEDDRLLNLK